MKSLVPSLERERRAPQTSVPASGEEAGGKVTRLGYTQTARRTAGFERQRFVTRLKKAGTPAVRLLLVSERSPRRQRGANDPTQDGE